MIQAYFDESGIHQGSNALVIAGYFGTTAQWKAFRKKWLKVLGDFDFPLKDFHTTDLIRQRAHEPMLAALADAVARSEIYPVSSGIIVPDFKSFSEKQRKWLTGAMAMPSGKAKYSGSPNRPYFVPFQKTLENVTAYAQPGRTAKFYFGVDRPVAKYAEVFFEQIKGHPLRGFGWQTRDRLGTVEFPLAKETPELQAADLLAFLTYRHMEERYALNDWSVGPSGLLATCLRKVRSPYDHGFETKDSLQVAFDNLNRLSPGWDKP